MKKLAAIACIVSAALVPSDVPRWAPQPGAVLTRSFASTMHFELERSAFEYGGSRIDLDALGLELELDLTRRLEATDRIASLATGRPQRLERTFSALRALSALDMRWGGDERTEFKGTSPLEGRKVAYEYDDERATWTKTQLDSGKLDPAVLDALDEDLDLRGVIEFDALAVGAVWHPGVDALRPLLLPAGRVSFRMESAGEVPFGPGVLSIEPELLLGKLEGEVRARYEGTVERGDESYGRIALEFDLRAERDLRELVASALADQPEWRRIAQRVIDCRDTFEWKGEGVLLWDLDDFHLHAAELEGAGRLTLHAEMEFDAGGRTSRTLADMTFVGKVSASAEVRH